MALVLRWAILAGAFWVTTLIVDGIQIEPGAWNYFWGFLPLLLIIAVVDLATMSQARRVRMLRRCGMTQAAIADRLQISRYRVRQALA